MTTGERLKKLRKSKGLTQSDLGKIILTSRSYISRVETGFEKPNERWIKLIALSLGVEFNWLMYGKGKKYVANSKRNS